MEAVVLVLVLMAVFYSWVAWEYWQLEKLLDDDG